MNDRPHQLLFALSIVLAALTACSTRPPTRGTPICPGSAVQKAEYWDTEMPDGRFATAFGLMRGDTVLVRPDYVGIWPIDLSGRLCTGRRIDDNRLDLLHTDDGRVVRTDFTAMQWSDGPHGLTLLGQRPGAAPGRQDVVVIDPHGNEFCTLYALPGRTRIFCQGAILAIDSHDENGAPYSSVHDAFGTPISTKLAPLVHTQYVTAGNHPSPYQGAYRLPVRVFPPERDQLFAPGSVTSCVVVGTLPEHPDRGGFDRRLLRPLLPDGRLAPVPAGALGWLPVHLDDQRHEDLVRDRGQELYSLHTHWAIVYPHGDEFRFAVGCGELTALARAAELGTLPVYDRLVFLEGAEASMGELGKQYFPGGRPGCYVVQDAVTGAWIRMNAETWSPTPNGDNGGAGFLSFEEAKRGETTAQTAARLAQAAAARAAAAREQLERQRRFEAAIDAEVAKLTPTSPSREWRDLAWRSGRASIWNSYLSVETRPRAADLAEATRGGAAAGVLYEARRRFDASEEVLARDRREEAWAAARAAEARRAELVQQINDAGTNVVRSAAPAASGDAPGTYFLNRIGYDSMVQQNTRAWSNGANPWGHGWGPR
ncbi:MAG: hypothetical protein IT455_11460 [Planctomycetes bacterium]|nr:hypothetical protein [Planctomycetota bacterium]